MSKGHSQWVNEALRHGISCSVVESHRSLGRHGRFEDACRKTCLRLTPSHLEIGPGGSILSVQLKELRRVEYHEQRPSSPVFQSAEKDVFDRLTTLRWNHTGRQAHTKQYRHVVFPTYAETRIFCDAMGDVQRYGIKTVLAGRESENEPTTWQMARAREHFKSELKKWRGKRLGSTEDGLSGELPCKKEDEEHSQECDFFQLGEDEDMHVRWAVALESKSISELSPETLAALVHTGIPLKYRYALWSQWLSIHTVEVLEDISDVPADVAKQIQLDLPRTQQQKMLAPQQRVLEQVLKSYALRNPIIGYCQGMNFIAMIFILLGFDEQTVFTGLCFLVERICRDYHALGLSGYIRDTAVLSALVHLHLPQVHMQLEIMGVHLHIIALDHFMTLAARVWPFAGVIRLWDLIFMEGSPAVFASFLALLELDAVAAASQADSDSAEFMQNFQKASLHRVVNDFETVMVRTRGWISMIPPTLIEKLRSEILTEDED